ncbi:MAG: chromate transporter [Acidobacteria bacterium]|nr:MAG: chromate transporter [Acidobacteriota bacterium]
METTLAASSKGTLRQFVFYFLRLGTFGFGGPIALAARMQKDLVEELGWISQEDYTEGLAFSQLSPGPLAAQLAMYLGWVRFANLGATLTGTFFILPSFLMVLGIAALYLHYGSLSSIQSIFYGVGSAVVAILVRSAYKLTRTTLKTDSLLWVLFTVSAVATAWTKSEIIWLFVLCAIVSMIVKTRLRSAITAVLPAGLVWLTTGIHGPAGLNTGLGLFTFFLKAGAFVFGSGLAIVPFLYGGLVVQSHWLTERQFLDAVAVAMITPGPVVITAGFIGYLVAGPVGAVLAALAVFAPPYFIVLIAAPLYRRFTKNLYVNAFVKGVTAAAIGAITGAVFILASRTLVDRNSILIAGASLGILSLTKKIPEPVLILLAGLVGFVLLRATH